MPQPSHTAERSRAAEPTSPDADSPDSPAEDAPLRGKRIALTGRFALWTHPQLIELLLRRGALSVRRVDAHTDWVVVGGEGWPLRRSGALTLALQRARAMAAAGSPLEVIGEEELLRRMQGDEATPVIRSDYHLPELARIIGVSGRRLRGWVEVGLIRPVRFDQGVPRFDYSQAAAVRMLWRLARKGVNRSVLRRNLHQLGRWLPGATDAARQLEVIDRTMVIREHSGGLVDRLGQRWLDFDSSDTATIRFLAKQETARPPGGEPPGGESQGGESQGAREAAVAEERQTGEADAEFAACVALEAASRWRAAAVAYRRWMDRFGPDPDVAFNLGNVLVELDQAAAAIAAYRKSLACDAARAETWNNLGNVLADCGQRSEAVAAYRRALICDPPSAEAVENLESLNC